MRCLKDNVIHVGSQLGFQSSFYIVVKNSYSFDYIFYGLTSLAIIIGWMVSTFCVYLTVDRLINRAFYKEPLTTATFTPPLAFVLLLLVNYIFDGLTGDVSATMAWVNLILSLGLSSLYLFHEGDSKKETEKQAIEAKKEEPLPTETPFKLTSFNNDVRFLWNRIHALLQVLTSSKVEERHVLENMQRELHRMDHHYTQIPHEKRKEVNTTVAEVLSKMEEKISSIEEDIFQAQLRELQKTHVKYHA